MTLYEIMQILTNKMMFLNHGLHYSVLSAELTIYILAKKTRTNLRNGNFNEFT